MQSSKAVAAGREIRSIRSACSRLLLQTLFLAAIALCAIAMEAQPSVAQVANSRAAAQLATSPPGAAACASCHKEIVQKFADNPHGQKVATYPGKTGTCDGCHGPGEAHAKSGDSKMILDAKQVDQKCQDCHKTIHTTFEHSMHGKANVNCSGCHSVHSAGAPRHLLKTAQPELCLACHGDVKPQFSAPFHHKVKEGLILCTDCHDPHGAFGESSLPSPTWQFNMCTKCHAGAAGPIVYEHAAVKGEGCSACHFAHGGPNPKMLIQADVNVICRQCHFPPETPGEGVAAVPEHVQLKPSRTCVSCHSSVHGSNTSDVFLRPAKSSGAR